MVLKVTMVLMVVEPEAKTPFWLKQAHASSHQAYWTLSMLTPGAQTYGKLHEHLCMT